MKIISHSPENTFKLGKNLARYVSKGDIICLSGQLGSGKTVFVKGLAAGLGIDKEEVISPTFVIVRKYEGRIKLFHLDLYRIIMPFELADLGYDELLYNDAVSAIEWPEKLGNLMPENFLKIDISIIDNGRILGFVPMGRHYQEVTRSFYEDIRNRHKQ
ncbi:MAG: tRNA (adenosine(37)-N6)-threonylcarbamoyltransferase complex ATPase subunit type 1 TsaE [Candidatus Omnitrophota bacterium]|jgi:tRNA threonylcarbamoyladenosine biosynthesis protein TsaE|nr:MAG: tRNA (adenosine(37)-N6)-threonylcarbamoyltransferase complex ATPase subunit type 1 TsaE [Candidatus Omnitrophota bacterium]